ncbi:MAG: hypothetical protein KatS3mg114_0045 [Planctomycetaceae bacterium]|nr:MAG: hypothetical protein KatS3mg114_0045 [Planctomycetaceae bacterium]
MTTEDLPVIPVDHPRCRHLLSKGMYINHGLPPGQEVAGEGNFWCGRTQTIYGPDDRLCDPEYCRDHTRSCYQLYA